MPVYWWDSHLFIGGVHACLLVGFMSVYWWGSHLFIGGVHACLLVGFTPVYWWGSCCSSFEFSVLCCVFIFVFVPVLCAQ